jgi:uncharacterized protein YjbJ (UPF0337 family)
MNTSQDDNLNLSGRWEYIRGKLKEKYPHLDDEDLRYDEGQEEMFIGRLQKRLGGEKRESIIRTIKTL